MTVYSDSTATRNRQARNREAWNHGVWFAPPADRANHPRVREALELVDQSQIELHPFFEVAARSREVLKVWVSQELIVTGPFTQHLLRLAARIDNVHLRAMVAEVAYGEHNKLKGATAERSHPWLLDRLRASVGLAPTEIEVLPETRVFLDELAEQCAGSMLRAVGALGVGNERLLVPEYSAVRRAFEKVWPDCEFEDFLDANIDEDRYHSALMARVGTGFIGDGGDPEDFFDGARAAIESRLRYYDALCARCPVNA